MFAFGMQDTNTHVRRPRSTEQENGLPPLEHALLFPVLNLWVSRPISGFAVVSLHCVIYEKSPLCSAPRRPRRLSQGGAHSGCFFFLELHSGNAFVQR